MAAGEGLVIDTGAVLRRIEQLLATEFPPGQMAEIYSGVVEALQGTVGLARILYGDLDETPQVHTVMKAAQLARDQKQNVAFSFFETVWPAVRGTLRAMKADVEAGLLGTIERRAAGEVIADMLGLAKEALARGSDAGRNVAAVLTAAAFEDTIRKMGATLAGVQDRIDLADVLNALKDAKVLVGAPFTTAQSYLKFRNDSLHADWTQLTPAVVGSCVSFTEGLLLQHFS